MASLSNEQVCRLDVSMDDALAVRRVESVGDLDGNGKQLIQIDRLTSY